MVWSDDDEAAVSISSDIHSGSVHKSKNSSCFPCKLRFIATFDGSGARSLNQFVMDGWWFIRIIHYSFSGYKGAQLTNNNKSNLTIRGTFQLCCMILNIL